MDSRGYAEWATRLMSSLDVLYPEEQIRILEAIEAEATRRLVKLRLERVER